MQVKVWNDNTYPHKELFKGDLVEIKPKSYVMMEYDDAILFRGQYTPILRDHDNQPVPQSYKMIRIEKVVDAPKEQAKTMENFTCQACGKTHASKDELEDHIDETHLEQMADPEVAQKRRGRPKKVQ